MVHHLQLILVLLIPYKSPLVHIMAAKCLWQCELDRVTQSSPSPGISCIHKAPHAANVSRIAVPTPVNGHSNSSFKESTTSNVLKDVHISAQLLEDFLELARENTSKDLETCGVLGAFLCLSLLGGPGQIFLDE